MDREPTLAPPTQRQRPSVLVVVVAAIAALFVVGGVIAGLWVVLSMPVRSEITRIEPAEEPLTDVPERQAALGIEDDARQVVDLLRMESAQWGGTVAMIDSVTRLRRPVIEIATSLGPEDAEGAERLTAQITAYLESISQHPPGSPTYYIQILSAEGDLVAVIAQTDARWVLEAPPSPTDTASLQGWLSEVYGPGAEEPEPWFARITEFREPAEDAEGYVVVVTDLDPSVPSDVQQAQWIISAIDSSGATFTSAVRVLFKDRTFEWSSVIDGVDPYAP